MAELGDTGELGAAINVHTKAGKLEVNKGCNCTYHTGSSGRFVMFGFSLNHRSEDIEAYADIVLSPQEARTAANRLLQLANELEENQDSNRNY